MMTIPMEDPSVKQAATWGVAEAKAHLSEVIDRALADGPQTITRNRRPAVVVVAADEWERKTTRKGNLADFFAASPLRGAEIAIERTRDLPREPEP
jgi:prevent-host-death family protein